MVSVGLVIPLLRRRPLCNLENETSSSVVILNTNRPVFMNKVPDMAGFRIKEPEFMLSVLRLANRDLVLVTSDLIGIIKNSSVSHARLDHEGLVGWHASALVNRSLSLVVNLPSLVPASVVSPKVDVRSFSVSLSSVDAETVVAERSPVAVLVTLVNPLLLRAVVLSRSDNNSCALVISSSLN